MKSSGIRRPSKAGAKWPSEMNCWQSPWSVVTEWWQLRGEDCPVVRTYRDGDRVIVEIEPGAADPAAMDVEVGGNHIYVSGSVPETTIPMPWMIDPESANLQSEGNLLRVVVARAGAASGRRRLW